MKIMTEKTTLLLLGHGSSKHPDSSSSVRRHAEILRQRGDFAEVHIAFLKEEPFMQDALADLKYERLAIVPDFLAEGYFTKQVIPALLGVDDLPDTAYYCNPVGAHPMMQELILKSAQEVLGDWAAGEVSLLLVGHGSTKNAQSKQTLLDHIAELEKTAGYSQIADLWLEEPPLVSDWRTVAGKQKIIVVPFLLSDGQHGGWDIPEMIGLGLEGGALTHGITHEVNDWDIRVAPALGTSPHFADVIVAVADAQR